jgi:mRNA export factor
MAGLFGSASATNLANNTVGDLSKDVQLDNPPEDTVSDLAFNPTQTDPKDFLAVSSWDKKVRIYEILSTGQGQGKHLYEHDAPVFSVDFFKVGQTEQQLLQRDGGSPLHDSA